MDKIASSDSQPVVRRTRPLARVAAILLGAIALAWPALYSGSPIWYPDAITYLSLGHALERMLLGLAPPTGMRSELYCLALDLLQCRLSPWPVVCLNALLVSWTIWLVVRVLCARWPLAVFAVLVVLLSALSTAPWYVSFLSPDILGGILYLGLFLLIFGRGQLARWEIVTLAGICCWSIASHPTHLLVGGMLCALLALLWLLRWHALRGRGSFVAQAAMLFLLAIAAQEAIHLRVFGKPSLFGPQPPFLMARLLADGPATDFLRTHCAQLQWTICASVARLPINENVFLWSPDGVYQPASPEQRAALTAEELPLLLGTLRSYPRRQIAISLHNAWTELTIFGLEKTTYTDAWTMQRIDLVSRGARAPFARALLRLDALPRTRIRHLQEGTMQGAALLCSALLAFAMRRRDQQLLGLNFVVVFVLVANAAVTGMLSGLAPRYEARIAWLLPLLAILSVYRLLFRDPAASRQSTRFPAYRRRAQAC
jgi:hypothetical protein